MLSVLIGGTFVGAGIMLALVAAALETRKRLIQRDWDRHLAIWQASRQIPLDIPIVATRSYPSLNDLDAMRVALTQDDEAISDDDVLRRWFEGQNAALLRTIDERSLADEINAGNADIDDVRRDDRADGLDRRRTASDAAWKQQTLARVDELIAIARGA